MKELFSKIFEFAKRKKIVVSILAIIVLVVIFNLARNKSDGLEDLKIVRGDVVEVVAVTGKAKAVLSADLSFERTGRVSYAGGGVGTKVSSGEVLARLDQSDVLADIAQAEASLREAQVRLQEIGRTSESAYLDAKINLTAQIRDSYAKVDDAIRNNVDQFFKNQRLATTYIEFSFVDGNTIYTFPLNQELKGRIGASRYELELLLQKWNNNLLSLDSSSDVSPYTEESKKVLNQARIFLDDVSMAANSLVATEYKYETTISGYKSAISSARGTVNTALTNLLNSQEKFNSAPRQVGGVGSFDAVLAQEARVAQARAQVESMQAVLQKTVLRSPITGTISKFDAKLGEIVSSGSQLISVISAGDMELEANVSEVNIGKVVRGNRAQIVFDAFPSEVFEGEIFFIDPAETLVDGIVNYKIKIRIIEPSSEIKSGLSADIRIKTEERKDVVKVPYFSVITRDGNYFVNKLENGSTIEVPVSIGLIGSDGFAEVLEGLSEGDTVRFIP